MITRLLPRRVLALALVAVVAGCSSAGSSTASPAPSAAPSAIPSVPASQGGGREIAVTMTDALRFEPDRFQVSVGETVRFVVTNNGKIRHEFFVGDEAAQAEHEAEMRAMGGMAHDEPNGISVEPGQTKELRITFEDSADTLIGCHEPGHYDGGMKATVTVAS